MNILYTLILSILLQNQLSDDSYKIRETAFKKLKTLPYWTLILENKDPEIQNRIETLLKEQKYKNRIIKAKEIAIEVLDKLEDERDINTGYEISREDEILFFFQEERFSLTDLVLIGREMEREAHKRKLKSDKKTNWVGYIEAYEKDVTKEHILSKEERKQYEDVMPFSLKDEAVIYCIALWNNLLVSNNDSQYTNILNNLKNINLYRIP